MGLGILLLSAALSLFLWNHWEAKKAEQSASELLPKVIARIEEGTSDLDPYDPVMTEAKIEGYVCIGCLSIPALELELPVLSEWDYARLKTAPCRYAGSVKTDDLVIAAHNYARHFGNLSSLKTGDEVDFTDMDGIVWTYEVVGFDILSPTDVEEMTFSNYDLTLFTCTYGGKSRAAVRCERAERRAIQASP